MADDKKQKEPKGLPEEWEVVRLGEVIEETYPGEWGDNPTDDKNIFPVFSTLAIDYDGRIDFTKAVPRKLNKKKIEKLKLRKGMILIEKSGGSTDTPAGKVAILKQDFEGTCSNFIQILKPNNSICDSYYLFYRLLYNFKNNLVGKYQQKTTGIINFILKEYFNEYIPLPPLPEQRKIAQILETVDNAIEKTEKIIEKYKRIKQGLMQDLLTKGIDEKGNIRSEKTHKFKDSPLGRIPEEWEVVRLGEILKYEQPQKYIVISDEYDEKSGIPVLTAGKTFILGYVDENEGICNDLPVILFDDFTTESRFIDFPFKVKSSATKILRAKDESIDLFYVYNALKLIRLKPSSDHKRFWISEYSKMPIPLPPLPEQKRIAEILSQIDQAIEKEEKYKQKLERLKKGLMEDLLTGKVRVNKLLEGENYGMA
uniref:Restriction endonuclease subunit S n=1 Tax=Thermocrinis ruber TaxID=75906 RepID=A0A7C5X434_9AQUI